MMTYTNRKSPRLQVLLSSGVLCMAFSMMAFQESPQDKTPMPVKKVEVQSNETNTELDQADQSSDLSKSIRGNRSRGINRRRGERSMRGPMSPEQVAQVIEVARDIDLEWGSSLEQLNKDDPQEASQKIIQFGRRLRGLVLIRERDPALYAMKVREFKCARELQQGAKAYKTAMKEGRVEEAGSLELKLRALVKKSMDLELQSRAMELAALDRALQDLKSKLQIEISTQQERLEERLREVLAATEPTSAKKVTQSR